MDNGVIVTIVFTQRGNVARLISARRAERKEKDPYYENEKSTLLSILTIHRSRTLSCALHGRATPERSGVGGGARLENTLGVSRAAAGWGARPNTPHGKLAGVYIRLHPKVIQWAKREAKRRHVGYQTFLSEWAAARGPKRPDPQTMRLPLCAIRYRLWVVDVAPYRSYRPYDPLTSLKSLRAVRSTWATSTAHTS